MLANAFGVVVPFLGAMLRARTGSWLPHLVLGKIHAQSFLDQSSAGVCLGDLLTRCL